MTSRNLLVIKLIIQRYRTCEFLDKLSFPFISLISTTKQNFHFHNQMDSFSPIKSFLRNHLFHKLSIQISHYQTNNISLIKQIIFLQQIISVHIRSVNLLNITEGSEVFGTMDLHMNSTKNIVQDDNIPWEYPKSYRIQSSM